MNDYIILVTGGQHNVTANSREDALTKIDPSELPWVLDVVEA